MRGSDGEILKNTCFMVLGLLVVSGKWWCLRVGRREPIDLSLSLGVLRREGLRATG
jgi:hypothetical protein